MTYGEILEYLYAQLPMFHRIGPAAYKPDLSNTIALCNLIGNPQEKLKCVHVAGTNGKGSTSHLIASALQEAGYKTFSHLWDESYDETFDPVQRMEKVCNVVEHLSTMSTTDLADMIKQSFEILEHNSKLLQSRRPEFQIMECIKGKL